MKKKSSERGRSRSGSRSEDDDDGDISTNNQNNQRREEDGQNRRRRGSPSSQEGGGIDPPPSYTSSFESRSSSTSRGGTGGGNDCRLLESHEGKIRPSASRDTISTTSLSHFDGNSSTGIMSHSDMPLGQHRRGRGGRRSPSSSLYNRQLNILMSSTGISIVLFLFFILNIFAFAALMSFAFSVFMLVYTSYAYIMYLIQSGEVNIFSLLPESTRNQFLNTSIHDMLTDNSGYMENRFLLLYFIPGLSPEHILDMVNRLPQRHRDLVLGPGGVARMLLPASVNNRIGNSNTQTSSSTNQNLNNAQYLALPVIEEEEHETMELAEEEDVTNRDALQGILSTARSLITGGNDGDNHDSVEEESLYLNTSDDNQRVEFQDMSWDDAADHEEDEVQSRNSDDDSGESDLGLEISSDDFAGRLPDGQLSRIARMIGLSRSTPPALPAPSTPPTTVTARPMITRNRHQSEMPMTSPSSQDSVDSQVLEGERNLEGEIINEAVSAMFNNYYDAAIQGITEVAANVADTVAPIIIRTGVRASSVSGLGLIGIFSSRMMNIQQSTMMGTSVSSSRNLSDSRAGRLAVRGLLSTLAIGIISAGSAYLTRAFIRRQRDLILSDAKKEEDENCDDKRQDQAENKE